MIYWIGVGFYFSVGVLIFSLTSFLALYGIASAIRRWA